MAADENNDLTPEQKASIQAIANRVKNLAAEQMERLEKLMEDNPDSIDFESMIDEVEKTGNDSLSNQENEAKQEEGRDTREEKDELPAENGSSDDSDNGEDDEEDLGKTIAYSPVDMPKDAEANAPEAGDARESGDDDDTMRDEGDESEKRDKAGESAGEPELVEEDKAADETAETAGEPAGENEKPNEEESVTVEDVEKMRKARRRSKRSFRVACLIIAISLAVIVASVASIIMVFSTDHFVPAAPVAIEDSEFGVSEDDLSMLSAEGYDGTELTDDVAEFMEAFFTFDKASVEDGSWQEGFEGLIAADDLVDIKENMLYTRLSEGWEKVFEDHPYYKSKWVSNNSISWNILPTSTVNVPYCDVYATIDCSPLDVYFLNSPSLEINRYVNCYRIVFDSDGKITSIKKLRTVQKQASVDRDAMRSDAENAEKSLEIQRRKAEQLAKEKAAAEAAERARQEAEEEAKRKAEEEAKAKEEADKKKEEENKNKNENTNTGNSNSNTNTGGNTNTSGNENTNTGSNTNTGGNANTGDNEPAPSEPASQESPPKQQQLSEQQ